MAIYKIDDGRKNSRQPKYFHFMNVEDGEQEVPDVEFHDDANQIKNEVTTREA